MLLPAAQIRKSRGRGGEQNLSKDKEPVHQSAGIGSWNPRFLINLYHPKYPFGPNGKWFCLHGEDDAWPFLDGTQRVSKDVFSTEGELSRESPGAVFCSYNKGDMCGFISSFPHSPRCSPLRDHENREIHRAIPKWTLLPPRMNCKHAYIHWPLSAERSHPDSHRRAPCTLPGQQVHSEQTRGLDGGQLGGREGNQGRPIQEADIWTEQEKRREWACEPQKSFWVENTMAQGRQRLYGLWTWQWCLNWMSETICSKSPKLPRGSWTGNIFETRFPESHPPLNKRPPSSRCHPPLVFQTHGPWGHLRT